MKKGEIYEGMVERIDFPCKGILTIEGERVVVKHALPGQRIRFMLHKKRKGKCEGRLLEILEQASNEQTEGVCRHFGICGGCVYQSLPYQDQLRIKEQQVKALIDSVVTSEYQFDGIKGSPIGQGYRNKMEFSFGDEFKDGPLSLGMHKRSSFYDVVSVEDCRIIHEDFIKILTATLNYFSEAGLSFYKKMQHVGYLRHLLVRRGIKTGEVLVDLVTTTQHQVDLSGWTECLLGLKLEGRFAGILHTENDSLADVVQNDRTEILFGQDFFYEELLGLRFRITPFSFFQTNSLGAEVLYEMVREYVGETRGRMVFDLYSGTGTIAQMIAPVARKVMGVEIVPEAVEVAKDNACMNGLENCEFLAGDVLKVIDEITEKPDLIVLDPPREGIHPKALPKIIEFGVERMVYISCKPTSLIRDLAVLQGCGYRVERVCVVDMFPGVAHVETIVSLQRGNL